MKTPANKKKTAMPVGSGAWLGCVEPRLTPIFTELRKLHHECEAANEGRIAWEISQGIRALDEAVYLAKLYISGKPLPTLASMRGILKRPNEKS
jgi:hypothetical protein